MKTEQSILLKLAEANETMLSLCHELHSKPSVKKLHHGFDLRKCGTGCLVDVYVEAEVSDDLAYCWWLEVRVSEEGWSLDGSILETKEGDQRTLERVVQAKGSGMESLLSELQAGASALADNARRFEIPPPNEVKGNQ